ncbi:MAG TPA: DUF58 domain-containing protein, partial [Pirellulaceae bacterium]|nr:DUF58 domain-containing protein [Pirellulaceae bacterium]
PESQDRVEVDARGFREEYRQEVQAFCDRYRRECAPAGIDYVQIDTSMQFDKALLEYLVNRRAR